jgi:phage terminase Nu1 subunit (DNA packaging protein)
MASNVFIAPEECFAPELDKDMPEAPPMKKKRTMAAGGKRTRDLEKENLQQIVFHSCDIHCDGESESDNDSDSDSDYTEGERIRNADKRIHYLKLDLANAKLETQELKERMQLLETLQSAFKKYEVAISLIDANITQYKALTVRATDPAQFANLIRDEIVTIKPRPTLDIFPITGHSRKFLSDKFAAYVLAEDECRTLFHNKIQYEQSKNTIIWMLKFILVFFVVPYIVLRFI